LAATAVCGGVLGVLGGCGWTARDEFLHAQKLTLTPAEDSLRGFEDARPIASVPDEPE
jgi:hypothetical protein